MALIDGLSLIINMLIPTAEQREQIELFFHLIRENYKNIALIPVIDEKTSIERLSICIRNDENDVYMLGLWFLPDDPLFKRFSFKEPAGKFISYKNGVFSKWLTKAKKTILHLWD